MGVGEVEIGSGAVNAAVMRGVADQHTGNPSSTCCLHVGRSVAEIPHRAVRRGAEFLQREKDRRGVGFVGLRIARADDRAEKRLPADMVDLGA